ncbi:MAG: hydroxylamine reductase, partial [Clostridiaceae bacterium]|nr:hydroxylamine reductase [Clostridiaceae bacterium]
MFCFQCEQTAGCTACTGAAGVCGKKADTAGLQDRLTGALIGLARATEGNESRVTEETDTLVLEGLFTTITNVNFNNDTISALIARVEAEKKRLAPDCCCCSSACGRNDNYDMKELWEADEDIRSLKSLILFGIRGVAAYAYHAAVLGYRDAAVNRFFYKALFAVGMKDWGMNELLPIVMEVGAINLTCMALLDRANTETYGNPVPTEVSLTVEKGPFIVISGHDLYDLKQLLEQTKDKGINVDCADPGI